MVVARKVDMDYTVRLTWVEGRKGTLFSRTFHTTIDAAAWGCRELLPYGIGYSIERIGATYGECRRKGNQHD